MIYWIVSIATRGDKSTISKLTLSTFKSFLIGSNTGSVTANNIKIYLLSGLYFTQDNRTLTTSKKLISWKKTPNDLISKISIQSRLSFYSIETILTSWKSLLSRNLPCQFRFLGCPKYQHLMAQRLQFHLKPFELYHLRQIPHH